MSDCPLSLSEQIRELVPESQAYMDLLAFERKLDQTIMRKRVDIQEALKRPMKVRKRNHEPQGVTADGWKKHYLLHFFLLNSCRRVIKLYLSEQDFIFHCL